MSREVPPPVRYGSGLKVDVGYENQKARYVFSEPDDDFIRLARSINEPWVFLKVCASPDEIKDYLSEKWEIQPQGYLMSCFHPMKFPEVRLQDDYQWEVERYPSTAVVKIVTRDGELASVGRVVLVDDMAVYDRISTEIGHRRKGLGTLLMKELEKTARSKGVVNNFLAATGEGRQLYQSFGWKVHSFYTSVVIPG